MTFILEKSQSNVKPAICTGLLLGTLGPRKSARLDCSTYALAFVSPSGVLRTCAGVLTRGPMLESVLSLSEKFSSRAEPWCTLCRNDGDPGRSLSGLEGYLFVRLLPFRF
ncbi:hypothetical protein ACJMK2_041461 [Sinanodonta woodiana]|uniref:Uncharacterized protein n=1 Tax=Sinanodonta woodiana TaxID=1069815 RepID=A0ABD3W639_SINWO